MVAVPVSLWPTITIEKRLEVLFHYFETAADNQPPFPLAYTEELYNRTTGQILFRLWSSKHFKHGFFPDDLPSTFLPLSVTAALSRLNLCDAFV